MGKHRRADWPRDSHAGRGGPGRTVPLGGPLRGSGARTLDRPPRVLREPPASMGEGDRELDKVALAALLLRGGAHIGFLRKKERKKRESTHTPTSIMPTQTFCRRELEAQKIVKSIICRWLGLAVICASSSFPFRG